jgi:hypothetical protein
MRTVGAAKVLQAKAGMARAIFLALLLCAAPAAAFDTHNLDQGGSLMLDDLARLIDRTPKLKQDIDRMLAENHKTMDKIICTGMRFSSAWKELGGACLRLTNATLTASGCTSMPMSA